ncbi:MAG: flagellar hook-basal body complex protein FliE [Phycisphaerales bacterium]|jgi:flagellar hook-basal body complex protein FliE
MADPLGFISGASGGTPLRPDFVKRPEGAGDSNGPGFKEMLARNLDEVNRAQQEANRAVEDVLTGQRTDVERVIDATRKADDAFRMLQALRNRVMEAYDEVKQMRV